MAAIPFIGQAYTSRSLNVNAQRCVNLYPEVDETGKNVMALYGTPGLTTKATATAAASVRGMWVSGSSLYVVSGNKCYKYNTSFVETELGTLTTSTGVVHFAENPTQIMLVDGTDGYIITIATDAFAAIADADFTSISPTHVVFIDTYFIVNDSGTQRFYISAQNDGTSWDALDFGSAEGLPDDNVALLADHRELWLFGDETSEVHADSGNTDFPYERISGAFVEQGCAASHSVVKMDNSVFWLGKNRYGQGIVWRAEGYTPRRVSTHAIEYAIQGYSTISDAIGFAYQQEGHTFYVLTFPTASKTWVFDAATMMWHERAYMTPADGSLVRHRANCYAFFNGAHLVGDHTNGKIYELDPDVYSDAGDEIKALRASPFHYDKDALAMIFYHRIQVDIEAGVGLVSGNGSDPQIILRWSDDGGHTWSNEHYADAGSFAAIGSIGEYKKRAKWDMCGAGRGRVIEVSITDPVKRVLIGASALFTMGTS